MSDTRGKTEEAVDRFAVCRRTAWVVGPAWFVLFVTGMATIGPDRKKSWFMEHPATMMAFGTLALIMGSSLLVWRNTWAEYNYELQRKYSWANPLARSMTYHRLLISVAGAVFGIVGLLVALAGIGRW